MSQQSPNSLESNAESRPSAAMGLVAVGMTFGLAFAATWFGLASFRTAHDAKETLDDPTTQIQATDKTKQVALQAPRSQVSGNQSATKTPSVSYLDDIRPLLKSRCYSCHGEDQEGGLRLDSRDHAMRGGDSGSAIVPHNFDSLLLKRITADDPDLRMPPEGTPLTDHEVATLKRWIETGADWPDDSAAGMHWAYRPLKQPSPPTVEKPEWVRNCIDAFTLARLEAEGVLPSPTADRTTLCRRLYFDLTGLPPTTAQVTRFLRDNRPDAYERLVEELLAAPHYGEKWATPWLDQARFADSDGFEVDHERPYAWRYRHWVIEALNADMPFDDFTTAQIAGDMRPNATLSDHIAVGFHRNSPLSREAGVLPDQSRFDMNIDRTSTIGSVWLAHTLDCARCHDHKFDDFSQREYYQLFAFMNSMRDVDIDAPLAGEVSVEDIDRQRTAAISKLLDERGVPELMADWENQLRHHDRNPGQDYPWDRHVILMNTYVTNGMDIIHTPPEQRTWQQSRKVLTFFLQNYKHMVSKALWAKLNFLELKQQVDDVYEQFPAISSAQSIREMETSPQSHIHVRGDYFKPSEEVTTGLPRMLAAAATLVADSAVDDQTPCDDADTQSTVEQPPSISPQSESHARLTRLDLARWLTSNGNPLTPRVIVNRQWQELFGRGLVKTSNDFGVRGERPTHPKLLDWLAAEFRDSGWSLKHMHRLIVTSATYRQTSNVRPELTERDPDNKLLARQKRLRLPAELVRDVALSVSNLRVDRIGGHSIKPPQPRGFANLAEAGEDRWQPSKGPDKYRRGLYIHIQRTAVYPQLTNFDAADSTVTSCRRETSNTPLQALNLLNDEVFFEAALELGGQLSLIATNRDLPFRLKWAFKHCLSREPTDAELAFMDGFYDYQHTIFSNTPRNLKAITEQLTERGWQPDNNVESACWVCVARLLMNLDEFITRE